MKAVTVMIVASLGFGLVGCGPGAPPPSAPSVRLDKALPKFKRTALNGEVINTREPDGQMVVVKFFAKYCEPCMRTLPEAQQLHEDNGDVRFVGVAEDEYQSDVEAMISRFKLSFPVIHDRGNVLAGRFRVDQLPATFIADGGGSVRWVGDSAQTDGALEAAIEWVKSQPASP